MIILIPVESLSHLFCLDSIPYVTSHSTQEYISDVVVNDADEPVWNIATGICRMACWTAQMFSYRTAYVSPVRRVITDGPAVSMDGPETADSMFLIKLLYNEL